MPQSRASILEPLPDKDRFWVNTDTSFLMHQIKTFEQKDRFSLMKFMAQGMALAEYAASDDLDGFQKLFV